MYSQNDEERVIVEFFNGQTGSFLDIGAGNGVTLSNTRKLLELGWRGVLVEPFHTQFAKLAENCRGFKESVTLIQAAVSTHHGLRQLWYDESPNRAWAASINREMVDIYQSIANPFPVPVYVATIPVSELLVFGPYDFVSIDAEWEDHEIIRNTPKECWSQCRLMCVESGPKERKELMRKMIPEIGFKILHETRENILAGK